MMANGMGTSDEDKLFLKAKHIVDRVYELDRSERDVFLRQSCGTDEALNKEVRQILFALHGPQDGFLEWQLQQAEHGAGGDAEADDPP